MRGHIGAGLGGTKVSSAPPDEAALGSQYREDLFCSGSIGHGIAALIRPSLICCLLLLTTLSAGAAEPKRVLVVHSFGSVAPPFTTHSTAFEAELVKQMGNRVDLDEVSLDMARYAHPDMQEALVDYLEKRGTQWKPDLVTTIGGPAGMFVAKYRQRLFPDIPILYCSLDQRLLKPEAFEGQTTFIGANYEVSGFVEDILQIAPDTKNIAIVIGATPLEQYWAETFRKGFEPFTNRVNFMWLNDLSFEQMLQRVQTLPPHSFIFLILFVRDAAGVTQNADDALQRLHAVANAPINSIFTSQMGLGIVGGRLYPSTEDGMQGALTAVRILNGEPASTFPHRVIPPSPPQYDWRELQRWHIDSQNLPPNSKILFRSPTIWQQYQGWIIAGASLLLLQTLLIAGLFTNLVRRRRAEGSLLASEARIGLAAEAAQLGAWEMDTATKEVWVSDKVRSLFQLNSDRLTYEAFQERVHRADRAKLDAVVHQAIEKGSAYEAEFRIVLPDGTIRWINGRARCVSEKNGHPCRLLGVSMDVTTRKQAEQLFQLATEASPSGIVLVDSEGLIVLVNAHIEKLFGYNREELIGKPVEILAPPRLATDHPFQRSNFSTAPKARITGAEESFAVRKSGEEFPVEIGLNSIETPQTPLVLATVTDISERKAAEAETRRRREQIELLSRVSLLGEMTASIAHELNQPLAAIVGNASAGQRFIDKGDAEPGALREIFVDVAADARRAHDVIQNIRNTIKKGAALRERINLNHLVEHVAHLLHSNAASQSCEFETSLAENLDRVEGDPIQLQQVLINLVSNAIDAMGEVPVAERKVEIATSQNGNGTVCVSVRDHGSGVQAQTHQKLFEQFFTTKPEGLGMGLTIVRSIIEAHGGRIAVENAGGGGARFYFTLPVSQELAK